MWTVYEIRCRPTGVGYIGRTGECRERLLAHFASLRRRKHANRGLQAAFDEHGESAFECVELRRYATEQAAGAGEKEAIRAAGGPLYNRALVCRPPQEQPRLGPLKMGEIPRVVVLHQAAALAGISKRTLQLHVQAGTAPPVGKIGREIYFMKADVLAWKDRHYPHGTPRKGRRRGE